MLAFHHDSNTESCGKDDGATYQEISAAFIRPEGAVEWLAIMGVYVSNSPHKKLYRNATLNGILRTRQMMQSRAAEEGMKLSHFEIVGDLNMRLTRKERSRLEFNDWEESDLGGAENPYENLRWHDEVTTGTYSADELCIVQQWLDQGLKIVNGRLPYDSGDPTRAPFHSNDAVSILDYVLTDKIQNFAKIERISFPEISDHQALVLRKKKIDVWTSLSKPRPKSNEISSISQVKWTEWEECDFCRYNDFLEELLREFSDASRKKSNEKF